MQYLVKAVWSQALMRAISVILQPNQNVIRGKVTQSSVLSQRIALTAMCINGKRFIIIKNDAIYYFHHIIPVIATLAFYQLVLAARIICMFLTLLEPAQHHVMINGTPSWETYAHSINTLVMGSFQGTRWEGPAWFAVANLIMTVLSENQPGIYLTSPDGKTTDKQFAKMSVDYSRQVINKGRIIEACELLGAKVWDNFTYHGSELPLFEYHTSTKALVPQENFMPGSGRKNLETNFVILLKLNSTID